MPLLLGHWTFVRNDRAGGLLENFFISAVVAILTVRLYLLLAAGILPTQLTARIPTQSGAISQIGGQIGQIGQAAQAAPTELHIAHVLWGGLLMLVAVIILLAFLSRSAKEMAAIIGGIGFGVFIDELGKFITGDNNYFFQPAIALIYVTLVLLFVAIRAIQRPKPLSERNTKVNVLELAKQVIIGEGEPETRAYAQRLLEGCDSRDPTVRALQDLLIQVEPAPPWQPHLLNRAKSWGSRLFHRLVRIWWFPSVVMVLFVFQTIVSLSETLATINWAEAPTAAAVLGGLTVLALLSLYTLRHRASSLQMLAYVGIILVAILVAWVFLLYNREATTSLTDWLLPPRAAIEPGTGLQHTLLDVMGLLQVLAPTISGLLVAFGIMMLWRSRLTAYRMFHDAVLISILLTQVFAFYENQLLGVVGLLPNLLMLAIVRFLIRSASSEHAVEEGPATPGQDQRLSGLTR